MITSVVCSVSFHFEFSFIAAVSFITFHFVEDQQLRDVWVKGDTCARVWRCCLLQLYVADVAEPSTLMFFPPYYEGKNTCSGYKEKKTQFHVSKSNLRVLQDLGRRRPIALCTSCHAPSPPPPQPSSAPVLKQSKQIKVLQGITSQNTARSAANMISANVRKSQGSGDLCGL